MRAWCLLVILAACGDDSSRHIVDAGGVAAALDGLAWQMPCVMNKTDGYSCTVNPIADITTTLGGDSSVTYDVTLHFRGVAETEMYSGGKCNAGMWTADATSVGDGYNIYELRIGSPAHSYYLNNGVSPLQYSFAVDYMQTIAIQGGSSVTLHVDPADGAELQNIDMSHAPIMVSGTSVAQPYNGQFIEMSVVSVGPSTGAVTCP
jgi:hypothetical protein